MTTETPYEAAQRLAPHLEWVDCGGWAECKVARLTMYLSTGGYYWQASFYGPVSHSPKYCTTPEDAMSKATEWLRETAESMLALVGVLP